MIEITQLLKIVRSLKEQYSRGFTLDGKLVGDIGEVLSSEKYGLRLLDENAHVHDSKEISTGRLIQIKSSFRNVSYFPCRNSPDYYLAIQIFEDGSIEELFNGPGQFIIDRYINARGLKAKNRYVYTLSGNILRKLNEDVPDEQKINLI